MAELNSTTDKFERADVVLQVADLRAGYGRVPVLHGVNLQIHEGEAVGIVGHNGMGKTTLLKVIMGLMPSTGGRIELDGTDATGSAAHQRSQMGIGYVPQGRGILPGLTALENLRMAWREDIGETKEQSVERVADQFPRLRVLLDRKGGSLSGGEQQILALARALMPKPWLLLLDEPSEGIQPSIVQEIGTTLAKLRDDAPPDIQQSPVIPTPPRRHHANKALWRLAKNCGSYGNYQLQTAAFAR